MSYEECCGYFVDKFCQWDNNGIIEPYVTAKGAEEFRADNRFMTIVCSYVSQFAENRKAAIVSETIMNVVNPFPLNVPSTLIDILVVAILKACRRDKQSEELLRIVLFGSLFALASLAITEAIKDNGRRSRRSRRSRK